MPTGMSLHIGLNTVDPRHYGGWDGALAACEADADDLEAIAKEKGFKTVKLLSPEGTRERVIGEITRAAKSLKSGDIFFLTYSGHGGQLPDLNNDEDDQIDETWCLFDGQVSDDHLYDLYGQFAPGVRILILSDSCHSGSVAKMAYYQGTVGSRSATATSPAVRYRVMPREVAQKTYRQNRAEYDAALKDPARREAKGKVQAAVILISGCQDNQLSSDGTFNGLFTANLLEVWNNGTFRGGYVQFHKRILRNMPPDQTPNFFRVGAIDRKFEAQTPFTI